MAAIDTNEVSRDWPAYVVDMDTWQQAIKTTNLLLYGLEVRHVMLSTLLPRTGYEFLLSRLMDIKATQHDADYSKTCIARPRSVHWLKISNAIALHSGN